MATYSDNFNRADGALGAPWVTYAGTVGIEGNEAANQTATEGFAAYEQAIGNDGSAEATIGSGTGWFGGPMYRMSGSSGSPSTIDGYLAYAQSSGASSIQKVLDGVWTQIGAGAGTNTAVGDVIKLACTSTTLTQYENGVSENTTTDAALTSGYAGLGFYSDPAAGNRYDNWTATDGASSVETMGYLRRNILRPRPFGPGLAR